MDKVFIENLKVHGKHGVHAREREVEQEFLIDIEVELDTATAAKSDDLADTANYSDFRGIAQEVVAQNSFYLIEKLADTIASRILEDKRIERVRITIRKPHVFKSGVPGVVVTRER